MMDSSCMTYSGFCDFGKMAAKYQAATAALLAQKIAQENRHAISQALEATRPSYYPCRQSWRKGKKLIRFSDYLAKFGINL